MSYKLGPLKWAGGKNKVLKNILPVINKFEFSTFVEPFVGAGNVCLNIDANNYILADLNEDLTNTYEAIAKYKDEYELLCEELFDKGFEPYNELREEFNNTYNDMVKRAALFQYLNKHGFNGLCRYNKKGKFNVPRGTVTKYPKRVPYQGIGNLHNLLTENYTQILLSSFEETFRLAECEGNALIYNDPPYLPLTSEFNYTKDRFSYEDQVKLKELSKKSKHVCLISNHWTKVSEQLYSDADEVHLFDVQRTISCKGGDRKKVQECLVVYY